MRKNIMFGLGALALITLVGCGHTAQTDSTTSAPYGGEKTAEVAPTAGAADTANDTSALADAVVTTPVAIEALDSYESSDDALKELDALLDAADAL